MRTPLGLIYVYWGAMWILESNIDATNPFPQLEIKWIQLEAIDDLKTSSPPSIYYEKNQKKDFLSLGLST